MPTINTVLPRGEIGKEAVDNPYLPFPIASHRGILDKVLHDSEAAVSQEVYDPRLISNELMVGRLPNHKQAGVLALPGGEIWAVDHVFAEVQNNVIYMKPSGKTAIDKETGVIQQPGLIVLANRHIDIRILGIAVDVRSFNPWEQEGLGIETPFYLDDAVAERRIRIGYVWGEIMTTLPVLDYDDTTGEMLVPIPRT